MCLVFVGDIQFLTRRPHGRWNSDAPTSKLPVPISHHSGIKNSLRSPLYTHRFTYCFPDTRNRTLFSLRDILIGRKSESIRPPPPPSPPHTRTCLHRPAVVNGLRLGQTYFSAATGTWMDASEREHIHFSRDLSGQFNNLSLLETRARFSKDRRHLVESGDITLD